MLTFLKRFFTDETAFIGLLRGLLMALGAAVASGNLPIDPMWSALILGASGTIRAGDKNKGK